MLSGSAHFMALYRSQLIYLSAIYTCFLSDSIRFLVNSTRIVFEMQRNRIKRILIQIRQELTRNLPNIMGNRNEIRLSVQGISLIPKTTRDLFEKWERIGSKV